MYWLMYSNDQGYSFFSFSFLLLIENNTNENVIFLLKLLDFKSISENLAIKKSQMIARLCKDPPQLEKETTCTLWQVLEVAKRPCGGPALAIEHSSIKSRRNVRITDTYSFLTLPATLPAFDGCFCDVRWKNKKRTLAEHICCCTFITGWGRCFHRCKLIINVCCMYSAYLVLCMRIWVNFSITAAVGTLPV